VPAIAAPNSTMGIILDSLRRLKMLPPKSGGNVANYSGHTGSSSVPTSVDSLTVAAVNHETP